MDLPIREKTLQDKLAESLQYFTTVREYHQKDSKLKEARELLEEYRRQA